MNLELYISNNELIYYKNIKDKLKNNSNKQLKKDIEKKIRKLEEYVDDTNDSIMEEKKSELETKLSETDEGYFYKPWNKMATVHKIIKIKEYVNNLDLELSKKEKLVAYLKKALKDRKISKNEHVLYSVSQGKIVSIPQLKLTKTSFSL